MTATVEEQLAGALDTIALLQESLADVEASFAREDRQWQALGNPASTFTPQYRERRTAEAVAAAAIDPLIKRASNLRAAYIFAGGITVGVRDDAATGQDVGAVVNAFWGDEDVQETFSSTQALLDLERQNGTAGEIFLALPTDRRTGHVRVRSLTPSTVTAIHYDPEDAVRPWFYEQNQGAKTVLYPALTYRPAQRPTSYLDKPIRWDSPVLHVAVNKVGDRGVGDLWAAIPWARTYKTFLSDWAALMRALSKVSSILTTRGDRVQQATAHLAGVGAGPTGQGITVSAGDKLQALSTSGARFDADSGRPLAVMAAAAVDLSVTTLLGDPGVTGARATAETVASESWAVFGLRQDLWAHTIRHIIEYVIDSAVIAPYGPLRGTIRRDGDRQYAELPEGDDRTIIVTFAERDDTATLDKVKAIVSAAQAEVIPPLVVARLLMDALQVPDVDDVLALITDEDTGSFIPLDILEDRVRQRLADRGEA